jgi:hypothetical protein
MKTGEKPNFTDSAWFSLKMNCVFRILTLIQMRLLVVAVILFLAIGITSPAFGRVLRVDNVSPGADGFTSLQTAIEYAAPGDTIHVAGSPVSYGNIVIDKRLVILGGKLAGAEERQYAARLTRVLFTDNPFLRTSSTGSCLAGFEFQEFRGERANITVMVKGQAPIQGVLIKHNLIWSVQLGGNAQQWTFRNNIIARWLDGGGWMNEPGSGMKASRFANNVIGDIRDFSAENTFENNVIGGQLMRLQQLFFKNNIFFHHGPVMLDVGESNFVHNWAVADTLGDEKCYAAATSFAGLNHCLGLTNHGRGNQSGRSPGLAGPTAGAAGLRAFELQPGSPARSAGVAGQQPGIFGGEAPFTPAAFVYMNVEAVMALWFPAMKDSIP